MPVSSSQTPVELNITDRNTLLPFFPSQSWNLEEADKGNELLLTFNWIQAFFDATALTVAPELAVWSGKRDSNGAPIVSKVRFGYSGERVAFKGKGIFATGTDIRGDTVNSAVIGSTDTTDLLEVIAYGGAY